MMYQDKNRMATVNPHQRSLIFPPFLTDCIPHRAPNRNRRFYGCCFPAAVCRTGLPVLQSWRRIQSQSGLRNGYDLVKNDEIENRKLTLDDVVMLSQKGDALTWSDFERYQGRDVGSALRTGGQNTQYPQVLYCLPARLSVSRQTGSHRASRMSAYTD